jgi:hypothetical protein
MYNLFLFTDREIFRTCTETAWQIRLGIVTPCMFIILPCSIIAFGSVTLIFMADFSHCSERFSIIMIFTIQPSSQCCPLPHRVIILNHNVGNIVVSSSDSGTL